MLSAYQLSTFNRMSTPEYGGLKPLASLKEKGLFGIGTFESLDGELVVNNGKFYHCSQGKCVPASNQKLVAWACLHSFSKPRKFNQEASYDNMAHFVNEIGFSNLNDFLAIRIKGVFKYVKLTSTPKQKKPYPTIEEVIKQCDKYYCFDVGGVAIGYYVPDSLKGTQSPGLHLHFVSEDGDCGGHVLDFYAQSSQVEIEKISDLDLEV